MCEINFGRSRELRDSKFSRREAKEYTIVRKQRASLSFCPHFYASTSKRHTREKKDPRTLPQQRTPALLSVGQRESSSMLQMLCGLRLFHTGSARHTLILGHRAQRTFWRRTACSPFTPSTSFMQVFGKRFRLGREENLTSMAAY